MAESVFVSALAKLDRADAHVEELRGLLLDYMRQPDVVTGTMAGAPRTGHVTFLPVTPMVQVVIGDIAHNLRSALEHVTWQLVLANGGRPKLGAGGTQFPILAEEPPAPLEVRAHPGPGVSTDALRIIEAAQPYKDPEPMMRQHNSLAVLAHVSNTDKHREPALAQRILHSQYSTHGTSGDPTQPWEAPINTVEPQPDHARIVLAEVPEVLGDGWAGAWYSVQLRLKGGESAPIHQTLARVAREVRILVNDLVATVADPGTRGSGSRRCPCRHGRSRRP